MPVLQARLNNRSMAKATKLAIDLGRGGRIVKITLLKMLYSYLTQAQANIEWPASPVANVPACLRPQLRRRQNNCNIRNILINIE